MRPVHSTTIIFLLLFCGYLSAQRAEVRYGKINGEDRKMMSPPTDSTAEAYVLHDELSMNFLQSPEGSPMLKEYRHRRVKLFTPASFERADVEIIYQRESERISRARGIIHFPEGGSRKLSKSDFIRERYDDERDIYKFTFPGVREGAVIEYSYTKTAKHIVSPSRYYFQQSVPVRWAQYKALIPTYFNYVSLSTGANDYAINSLSQVNSNYGGQSVRSSQIYLAMKDLAAYDLQPYVNNFNDYLPQVRMQLQSVQYPGQQVQKVFSDWNETTKDLDDWADFGKAYRLPGHSDKVWRDVEPLLAGGISEEEKAQFIYDFVTTKISWDGSFSWTAENSPNKVYDAARGTSGEMSMLLLALLNRAGIAAKPLLVTLRNGGQPIEMYPLLNQFDHLMVMAILDGKEVILDPNAVNRPVGLPRRSALNHRAFVAAPDNPHWMDVKVPSAGKAVMLDMMIDEAGIATVELRGRLDSYYGFSARQRLEELEDDNEFPVLADILEAFPETELISKDVTGGKDESGPLTLKISMQIPVGRAVDDFLYVQPLLYTVFDEGLAEVEQRRYPVDFGYPWRERYIVNLTVPEGYVAEKLPEPQRLVSPDKSLSVTFVVEKKSERMLSLNFSVAVKRTVYRSWEYADLRELFRRIIKLQKTTIVFKKKA